MYIFLLSLIIIRILYWYTWFWKLATYHQPITSAENNVIVSIVVCVKNNVRGIQTLLPKLLEQNYPSFNIVIVDDFSSDGLHDFMINQSDNRITFVKAAKDVPGKKNALTTGVNAANGDWILTTDADCLPASKDWVKGMVSSIKDGSEIVLGYGPLNARSGIVAMMASYEATYIAMQYLSLCLAGRPYMGVGRNMLFKKKLFVESMPYTGNDFLASGDDDFFIQKAATLENTTICIAPKTFCTSDPPRNLLSYFYQKTRHISTSTKYKDMDALLLSVFGGVHISIYLILIVNFFVGWFDQINAVALYLTMIALMFIVQYPCFVKLNSEKRITILPVADFFLAMYYLVLSPFLFINKKLPWK